MSQVPFFDLKRVYEIEKKQILSAIEETLDSGHYILGSQGKRFESEMKQVLVGSAPGAVVGCNSGTDAIQLALLAMGIGKGDEVIAVSHTAIPTITAIQAVGATPVLIDIHPETWVLDPARIPEALTEKTRAVVSVHLYGNMVDIVAVQKQFSKTRYPLNVIEDCAQAQGSKLSKKEAGTIGRFGTYSFYPTKNVGALGDGGAVFAKSEEDASVLRQLRYYGQKDRYHADIPRGLNSRLDELQAAILSVRLKSLEAGTRLKEKQMSRYREELKSLPLTFQKVTPECEPAWHLAVIALETPQVREELKTGLEKRGVQTLIHYPIPTHKQPAFSLARKMDLSQTESLANRILSIPLNIAMTDGEQATVIREIQAFFKG